jgi:hypothetical protein
MINEFLKGSHQAKSIKSRHDPSDADFPPKLDLSYLQKERQALSRNTGNSSQNVHMIPHTGNTRSAISGSPLHPEKKTRACVTSMSPGLLTSKIKESLTRTFDSEKIISGSDTAEAQYIVG